MPINPTERYPSAWLPQPLQVTADHTPTETKPAGTFTPIQLFNLNNSILDIEEHILYNGENSAIELADITHYQEQMTVTLTKQKPLITEKQSSKIN